MVKKFKLWRRPKDPDSIASKEFRDALTHAEYEDTFEAGYRAAKQDIIHFLMQKQMGYGEAFFFKISDIENLGNEN